MKRKHALTLCTIAILILANAAVFTMLLQG
jgi:hypothetical protein